MLKRVIDMVAIALLTLLFLFFMSFSFLGTLEEIPPRAKRMSDRGIYITAHVAKHPSYFNYLIWQARRSGVNTVVIDAKRDLEAPALELARERKLDGECRVYSNPWLAKLAKKLHDKGFIVTARLVVFKDDHLVIARPDLAVRMGSGGLYYDHKGGRWADPYADEVRLYNELIAEIAALSGVDEVQFDYIRFPAEGKANQARFPFEKRDVSRVEIINQFLSDMQRRLQRYNVSIAVDIFGVTAWQRKDEVKGLGQDLKKMAKYIDVLSPMFYPSHFHSGYDGYENPGSHPYYFVNTGVKKAKQILAGQKVKIIPWIQGFDLRSPNFGPSYISDQIRACKNEGIDSFLVWNAGNIYEATFNALR